MRKSALLRKIPTSLTHLLMTKVWHEFRRGEEVSERQELQIIDTKKGAKTSQRLGRNRRKRITVTKIPTKTIKKLLMAFLLSGRNLHPAACFCAEHSASWLHACVYTFLLLSRNISTVLKRDLTKWQRNNHQPALPLGPSQNRATRPAVTAFCRPASPDEIRNVSEKAEEIVTAWMMANITRFFTRQCE